MTQKELAERMDLTQPTISALEAGDLDRPGLATLKASYVFVPWGQGSESTDAWTSSAGHRLGQFPEWQVTWIVDM